VKSSNNQDEIRVVVTAVDVTDSSVQLFAQEAHSQVSLCYYTVGQQKPSHLLLVVYLKKRQNPQCWVICHFKR